MRKIKIVVLLVRQLQHGFTKNAKVSPNLTVAHLQFSELYVTSRGTRWGKIISVSDLELYEI